MLLFALLIEDIEIKAKKTIGNSCDYNIDKGPMSYYGISNIQDGLIVLCNNIGCCSFSLLLLWRSLFSLPFICLSQCESQSKPESKWQNDDNNRIKK